MGYLAGKSLYLSGAIQFSDDLDWRLKPIEVFNNYQINVFSPFDDKKQQWKPVIEQAAKEKDFETVTRIAKDFVRKDLCLVDRADFLVCYLPANSRTFGTTHEIINANNSKKCVLIVCPDGIEKIPFWFFGFIPTKRMFGSWDDLYDYIAEVDSGKHKDDDRWAYVYGLV